MSRAAAEAVVDEEGLAAVLRPRDGVVSERVAGPGRFELDEGPFHSYVRIVDVDPEAVPGPGVATERERGGRYRVRQVVDYELAVPIFGSLFAPAFRRRLARVEDSGGGAGGGSGGGGWPWWHPPARMDRRAATVLPALAVLAIAAGYLGTLMTQTITYAAAEFHAGKSAEGAALASVRFDVVFSIVLVAAADRRGRRRLLLAATALGAVLTVAGAVAPSLAVLAASQVVARSFVTASGVLILIVAAEEMPAGARAYGVSLLAMCGGLGAGFAVMLLPVADLGPRGWRVEFAAAAVWVLAVAAVRRLLPETRRFEAHRDDRRPAADGGRRSGLGLRPSRGRPPGLGVAGHRLGLGGHGLGPGGHRLGLGGHRLGLGGHGRRLWLLAVSAAVLAMFTTPASQFQNEFLRTEHHYSAARISVFILLTNTPAGLGIVIGGRLADLRGRRQVAVVALIGGTAATVLMFLVGGWGIWAWSLIGTVVGTAIIPALGVYGPELFPTAERGRANGIIKASDRLGSIVGLLVTGAVSASVGRIGPAIAILSVGPVILAVLILTSYPETAHLELEELNPEDA